MWAAPILVHLSQQRAVQLMQTGILCSKNTLQCITIHLKYLSHGVTFRYWTVLQPAAIFLPFFIKLTLSWMFFPSVVFMKVLVKILKSRVWNLRQYFSNVALYFVSDLMQNIHQKHFLALFEDMEKILSIWYKKSSSWGCIKKM